MNTINYKDFGEDYLHTLVQGSKRNLNIISKYFIFGLVVIFLCILSVGFAQDNIFEKDNIRIRFGKKPDSSIYEHKKSVINVATPSYNPNPFLAPRSFDDEPSTISDIPKFDLLPPPETIDEGSDAARVMDTIVSGIMYDSKSPSAIINIEGNDYLVKKGDTVNSYKILDITKESVTVKLGTNTYKAGIGQILTEGSLNKNNVYNINKRFGGNRT